MSLARAQDLHRHLLEVLATAEGEIAGGAHLLLDEIERYADRDRDPAWWEESEIARGILWLGELLCSRALTLAAAQADGRGVAGRCACGGGTFHVMRRPPVRCTSCGTLYPGGAAMARAGVAG